MFNPTWLYTGAVYAVAVAAARRWGVDLPRRVAVFFYLLVLVFFYRPLTQDYLNVPADFLSILPPWESTTSEHLSNSQMNDLPLQIIPWAHQVRESWRALEPPLWNALSGSGYPLLANGQSSALAPLRLLGLPLSLGHALTFESSMKILLALTFMFLWCRRRGYSELASSAGAVAYGFSTFTLVWLHFPIVSTSCLIPAIFYLLDLLVERPTHRRVFALAVTGAFMLFGGHPETVSHTAFFAFFYLLWIALVERRQTLRSVGRVAGALGIAAVLSAMLAAPLLLPLAEAVPNSKRFHELQVRTDLGEVPWSDWHSAILLFAPRFHGELPGEGWGPAHAESISGFAGTLAIASFFGLLVHVVARRRFRSAELFFLLATLFAMGVVLALPGINDLFHLVFELAANARVRLMMVLFLAALTAAMVDLPARDRVSFLSGILAAAVLLLAVLLTRDYDSEYFRDTAVLAILPGAALLGTATGAALLRRREWAAMAILVAVVAELWDTGGGWNPVLESKWLYPRTPILEALDELRARTPPEEPFRIVGMGSMLFPNTAAPYGFEDIRAHDPMSNGRYIGALRLIANYDADAYFAHWQDLHKRFVDYLNVRYVVTPLHIQPPSRFIARYEGRDGRIFENPDVLPRFFPVRTVHLEPRGEAFFRQLQSFDSWSDGAWLDRLTPENEQMRRDLLTTASASRPVRTTLVEAAPTEYRLHVRAPRYTLFVSSIPWWPGWKIQRNGVEFDPIRVNGAFLGFAVPEGEVDVRVWYDPWTFRLGAILALAAMVGMTGWSVFRHGAGGTGRTG